MSDASPHGRTAPRDSGPLLLVGGSERSTAGDQVLDAFASLAGGADEALVLVCGLAAHDPAASESEYLDVFTGKGLRANRFHVDDAHDQLARCTALWFTGGDQEALLRRVPEKVRRLVRERNREGLLVAGTNAGAAVMPRTVIIGGSDAAVPDHVDLVDDGFDLLDVIVDPQVSEPSRVVRLVAAVAQRGGIGIGIDEASAVHAVGHRIRAIGPGSVTVVDADSATFQRHRNGEVSVTEAVLDVLGDGDEFDLADRRRSAA